MSLVYPAESKSIPSDFRKNYWGSLFGPSEALALLEFAESNEGFVLYIASDIKQYDKINKSLAFLTNPLRFLVLQAGKFWHLITSHLIPTLSLQGLVR
jgi:transcription-repair coupling factor (superfamily II helicase)